MVTQKGFIHWKVRITVYIAMNSTTAQQLSFSKHQKSWTGMNIPTLILLCRCREALLYLVHACNLNSKLLDPGNPGQAMDEQLLTHWRRVCFLRLNELAVRMFENSDWKSVCAGLELVSELVVPCIPRLSASPQADDSLAVEQVRNCWCNFLASPLDGK